MSELGKSECENNDVYWCSLTQQVFFAWLSHKKGQHCWSLPWFALSYKVQRFKQYLSTYWHFHQSFAIWRHVPGWPRTCWAPLNHWLTWWHLEVLWCPIYDLCSLSVKSTEKTWWPLHPILNRKKKIINGLPARKDDREKGKTEETNKVTGSIGEYLFTFFVSLP